MIHQYKLSGYNIVLDVYSGSVHAVDDVAYDAIALIDQGLTREAATAQLEQKYRDRADVTPADISDCFDDIEELTAAGQLFAPDAYADHAFDFKNRSNVVKALCLHVAHTCNLNCSYCFAAQGKFHGEAGLMSFETGKRALDFLIRLILRGKRAHFASNANNLIQHFRSLFPLVLLFLCCQHSFLYFSVRFKAFRPLSRL